MSTRVSQVDGEVDEHAQAVEAQPEGERPPRRRERPATDSIADGVYVRSSYAVALEVFEGPLDLLLHLVRRHELDILDIPIAFITEKYIEYISLAHSLDIEVAGEYLLMAATLAFLKSRELLPVVPGEDDEEVDDEPGVDPREELIRRLIEYERFRDAGFELANRPLSGRDVFPRGGDLSIDPPEPGLAPVTLFRLAEAYNRVLDRAKINEEHEVILEPITVRERMRQLSQLLRDDGRIGFEQLFLRRSWSSERELRQMLVVTLMSVLEMVKLGILGVHQAQGSDTLELERAVDSEAMKEVVAGYFGEDEDQGVEDETQTPSAQTQTSAGETQTPAGETQTPAGETQMPAGETQTPTGETQMPSVEAKMAEDGEQGQVDPEPAPRVSDENSAIRAAPDEGESD